jgi:hypothetical protein
MHGVAYGRSDAWSAGCIDVDLGRKVRVPLCPARPRDDEFFRARSEVFLSLRRRIDRVEEQPQLGDMYFDQLAVRRDFVADADVARHSSRP